MTEKELPKKISNEDLQRIVSTPYNDLSGFERGVKLDYMFSTMQNMIQGQHQQRKTIHDNNILHRNETRLIKMVLARNLGVNFEDSQWNTMLQELVDADKGLRAAKEDEVVEKGDYIVVKYAGYETTLDDAKQVGGTVGQNEIYVGANQFIKSFEDAVMGAKLNEQLKRVPCPFPENYQVKEMAGKTIFFDITVTTLKKPLNRPPVPATPEVVEA
jgi:hypothetical protein